MGWNDLKAKWMKVYLSWFFSPSHRSFGPREHAVGLFSMAIANSRGRREDGSGWVVTALGDAMSATEIARELNMTIDEVEGSLRLLIGVGTMVRLECGVLVFPQLRKWQEDPSAERQRKRRVTIPVTVTQEVTRQSRVEERRQKKEDQKKSSGAQKAHPSAPEVPPEPSVLDFPCTGTGPKTWGLTQSHLAELQNAYDTIDVLSELKKLRQRCLADPSEKKTHRGYPKRLVNWLNRAVDWSRTSRAASTNGQGSSARGARDRSQQAPTPVARDTRSEAMKQIQEEHRKRMEAEEAERRRREEEDQEEPKKQSDLWPVPRNDVGMTRSLDRGGNA